MSDKRSLEILDTDKKRILFILFCACAVRIIALIAIDNYSGLDPLGRLHNTLLMFRNQTILPLAGNWLPLHFYLIAITLFIWNNILIAPRILHLILGVLSLWPFYLIIKHYFNKRIAFYSSLILVFFPPHLILSVITLSQIPFLFFALSAIYFLNRFENDPQRNIRFILICAVMSASASLIRYDGWFLTLVFIPYLLFKEKKQFFKVSIFISVTLAAPIFWIAWNYFVKGSPLYFLHEHLLNLKGALIPLKQEKNSLFNLLMPFLLDFKFNVFLVFIGLISSLILKKGRLLIIILGTWLFIMLLACFFGKLEAHREYTVNIEVLLLPFIISWVEYIPKIPERIKLILIPGLSFLCIFSFFPELALRVKENRINPEYKLMFQEVKNRCKKNENISVLIYKQDKKNLYDSLLIYYLLDLYSGLRANYYYFSSQEELKNYIYNNKPDYAVYYEKSLLDKESFKKLVLNSPPRVFLITDNYIIFKNQH